MTAQSSACTLAHHARPARDWADPALIFAVIVAVLMTRGDRLLADPDTYWHVKVGADIWRDKAVPWVDAYSHTFAGSRWIAKEWLAQVLLHGANAVGGPTALVLLTAVSVGLTFALMFAWLTAHMRAATALIVTLIALVLLMPHILARPHILALLPLFLWTRGIVEALDEDRAPNLWLLVLLAVWANLHNSVTIAYPIAGVLALEAIIAAPAAQRLATTVRWSLFGLAMLVAGCMTPYGYHSLLVTFTLFGSGEPLPFIKEWDPIGWTPIGGLAVASAIAGVVVLAAGGRRNAIRILLIVMLTGMMIRHVRFLDVYALVAPLVIAAPLVRRFPAFAPEARDPGSRWPLLSRIGVASAALAAIVLTFGMTFRQDPLVTPRAALDAARAAAVGGPVYNSYDYGGFLISEGVPTFIDGRTDQIYLGGFISSLMGSIKGEPDAPFIDFVEAHGAAWAIVPTGGDEARHFEATPHWPRLHRDEVASIYVKR